MGNNESTVQPFSIAAPQKGWGERRSRDLREHQRTHEEHRDLRKSKNPEVWYDPDDPNDPKPHVCKICGTRWRSGGEKRVHDMLAYIEGGDAILFTMKEAETIKGREAQESILAGDSFQTPSSSANAAESIIQINKLELMKESIDFYIDDEEERKRKEKNQKREEERSRDLALASQPDVPDFEQKRFYKGRLEKDTWAGYDEEVPRISPAKKKGTDTGGDSTWVTDDSFREEGGGIYPKHQPFRENNKTSLRQAKKYFEQCRKCREYDGEDACRYSCEIDAPIALKSQGQWYRNDKDLTVDQAAYAGWVKPNLASGRQDGKTYWKNYRQGKKAEDLLLSTKFNLMPTGGEEVNKMQYPCKLSDREILELENTPYAQYSDIQYQKDIDWLEDLETKFKDHGCCISDDDDNDCEKIMNFLKKKIDSLKVKQMIAQRWYSSRWYRPPGRRPDYSSSPDVEEEKRRVPNWTEKYEKEVEDILKETPISIGPKGRDISDIIADYVGGPRSE